ncbi:MAG: transketolase, partial [Clostridia bacterium]|nr:transketolase [Clostridia bacterium]
SEDVAKRHIAQGWNVIDVPNGNDAEAVSKAIKRAKKSTEKPTLIVCHTTIGYGSSKAGTADCHGSPLGAAVLEETKKQLNWNYPPFTVPEEVQAHFDALKAKGKRKESKWKRMFRAYKAQYPELAAAYERDKKGTLPKLAEMEDLWAFSKPDATRNTSFTVLNKLAELLPNLMGGSADLAPSNKSNMKARAYFSAEDRMGTNLHFGVREHAMAAITNGMFLHGGLIAYCATFFVFSDYMKNAIRMSAIMGLPVPYILTHDSIGVGEDGPTHQPIEHLTGLRSIPGIKVYRPADGKETTAAWISALTGNKPTCLVLTRQNLPQYENSGKEALKGGYILSDCKGKTPDLLLMASGSEVELIMKAQEELWAQGVDARVISMPCMEVFNEQPEKYREKVMPANVRARLAVEAGATMSWYRYVGLDGAVIGLDHFGASAPAEILFKEFGLTVENVVAKALGLVANK